MDEVAMLCMALAVLAYAAVSERARRAPLSSAMVFVAVGFALGTEGLEWLSGNITVSGLEAVTNATLVLVLFGDASQIDVPTLRRGVVVPVRLLAIGLPLTIALGLVAGVAVLPDLLVVEALVIAIILAPTDAALGQAVVTDERLPARLRQSLNVESGLNDGICVPLLAVALAVADVEAGEETSRVMRSLVEEMGWGVVAGAAGGVVTTFVLRSTRRWGGVAQVWRPLVAAAGAGVAYSLALVLGGSGFIAAFVAGLVFRVTYRAEVEHEVELVEEGGSLLAAVTFMLFGAVVLGPALDDLDWTVVVYALLSLTAVRMVPVAISMIGSHIGRPAVLLMGWFGPRGLASIVFGLIAVESVELPHAHLVTQVVALTVLASVVLHGVSAVPLVDRFVRSSGSADVAEAHARSPHETDGEMPPSRPELGRPTVPDGEVDVDP
jgi:NhaP-type Na+/H+ or K+/H+ antiporter